MSHSVPAFTVQHSHIDTLSDDDLAAIATLITELGYPTDAATQRIRLARMTEIGERVPMALFVARGGDLHEISGIAIVSALDVALLVGTTAELQLLVVAPSHRRQGIGEALVEAASDWARSVGAETITLRTANYRADAHAFYEQLGFAQITSFRTYRRSLPRSTA